jgi:hypothetical protein
MQQVSRRVIDVYQHRIEAAVRRVGIEAISGMRHREEGAIDERGSSVSGLPGGSKPCSCHSMISAGASITINDCRPRERDPGQGERARRQEFVVALDLVDVGTGGELPSAAQAEHAHRRRAKIRLFEIRLTRQLP